MNSVMWRPVDPHNCPDRIIIVDIARGLPTPWSPVNSWHSIHYPYYRIVIIKEPGSRNILQPETAMSAFPCSTLTKEKESLPFADSARGVNLDRVQTGCPESIHQH